MPYVKLDTRILESTLWVTRDPREVFITALLMAIPYEFQEPMPQIRVRALEETGFIVPPGWYGFVDAAGVGIVRRAMVESEAGLDALEQLGEPDLESRTKDFEGRRMVRVNGGFVILNFMAYRDRDNTGAERMKRYRNRKKGVAVTRNEDDVTRHPLPAVSSKQEAGSKDQELSTLRVEVILPDDVPPELPIEPAEKPRANACPLQAIVALYHEHLPMLPKVRKLTSTRAKFIQARWREDLQTLDDWVAYFTDVRASPFLVGETNGSNGLPPFRANLEWLCRPGNFAKTLEGNYHRAVQS